MQQQLNPRSSMGARKRSTMPSAASSLPLHGNTLHMHQQQMAMTAGGGGPIGAMASPSSAAAAAAASSPSAASNGSTSASGAQSGSGGGAGGGGSSLQSKDRMEMFCAQSDQVVVSVFVNSDYDKNGDAVAARILSDFTSQFSAQLLAGRIGSPDRMGSYPGGHEEAQADETLLPIYAGFKATLEASGLTKLEPKASATAATTATASVRDLDSPPPAALRSLQRTTSSSHGQAAQGGDGTGGSPRATPFFSSRTASAPAFRTLPGFARNSITASGAPPPQPAATGPPDDYLPSWIADEQDPSLLLLHSIPPTLDESFGVPPVVQLSSPSTLDDGAAHADASETEAEAAGGKDRRSTGPLLGGDQATSSPLIAARSVGSSVSPPHAQLDEIQLTLQ